MTINNNNIFGAFTLNEARGSRLTGDWLNKESVANYGWFGGGAPGPGVIIDRIDFSNDAATSSSRGSLTIARNSLAATGNSNYGWFGGGNPGPGVIIDRIDFSNDAATSSSRGSLSLARYDLVATGNSNYGWFGGGFNLTAPNAKSIVDRIDFSNDSATVSVRGPLSSTKYKLAASGNSNYGWFGGGRTPTTVATVDRIDFSNDTSTASPRGGALSAARGYHAATSGVLNIRRQKAGNYGWFAGGRATTAVPLLAVSTVDRIDFSNDTSTASPKAVLNDFRFFLAATGNSNYGFFGGGGSGPVPFGTLQSYVDRIDFSNDSTTGRYRGTLNNRWRLTATGNSNYGWFGGGGPSAVVDPAVAIVDRIDFSNDNATASLRNPLNFARYLAGATGNSNYGWFGGGGPGPIATVDRIDFSNDSSVLTRGSLTAREGLAATGNSNYGWFGGGSGTGLIVERINFSNDSVTASPRGSLIASRYYHAATGNSDYGWFGGGYPIPYVAPRSSVERINFSNDSVSSSTRGSLTSSPGRSALAATSNTSR